MKKQEKQKKKRESDILWNKKKGLRNYETNVISFLFMALFLAMAFYLVKYEINCSMLFSTLSIVGISL